MHYGLDIGGTKIALTVFAADMQPLQSWRLATPTSDYAGFLQAVVAQVEQADQLNGNNGTVGIALPGVIRSDGTVLSSNVPCLTNQPVAAALTQRLQRPVAIGNDCRCFALSEALLGAGKGQRRVFGAIVGTGAGGGFCLDGQLYQGASMLAGEFGHQGLAAAVVQQFTLPLFRCGCGLLGCAEPYVSGSGLARLYQHFSGRPQVDTYQWLDAYRQAEPAALATFACYISALGSVMAAQILTLDPDIIVLGGGLSDIPELLQALPEATARHLFQGARLPQFARAEFGAGSGVRGAALLGRALFTGQQYVS
ncbi:MAG: ROK family protein [Gammaproteobacteria bacterium]|nr:ROK family protein [Gammaproteobacteria bacterium]MBU1555172.1 ROK family protein [Gammaproteobacteria bacterium]MBU2068947.1 ROK family protein [Gammaproteobacteria bacterium]MBU2181453.1 ROK family protein [Gammaproteobacteria bacterium]MBU2203801.1 ROK family protein [Gammaproteobacteria bacterium]